MDTLGRHTIRVLAIFQKTIFKFPKNKLKKKLSLEEIVDKTVKK